MSKLSHVIYGQITNRVHGRKICKIEINYRTQLIAKVNTEIYHECQVGCSYFFEYNPDTLKIKKLASCKKAMAQDTVIAIENLDAATEYLIDCMNKLEDREREEALRAAGVVLTGFWAGVNTFQSINALFAWEPVNALIGGVVAIGAGILTKMQYESLTKQQKAAVEALKLFKSKLTRYHATVRRYLPEEMRENTVLADPKFTAIASQLKVLFKNITPDSVATNDVNYATT